MKYPIDVYFYASALSFAIGYYSFRRKSISMSGYAALVFISFSIIWLDKIALLLPLFYMFASSSLLSSVHQTQKQQMEWVLTKPGPRDAVQAFANLGVATAFILVDRFSGNTIWVVAVIGSVAAGNADSWASEIGATSKSAPFSILTFKPMLPGISGGITWRGTLAGFAGSCFIAIASVLTIQVMDPIQADVFLLILATALAGFFGMLFDSYLGALLQALYIDSTTTQLTENAEGNQLVKGFRWMNNDLVNFLSTLFGVVVALVLYRNFK